MRLGLLFSLLAALLAPTSSGHAQTDWRTRVTAAEKARTSPVAATPATLAQGAQLYANNCLKCHGQDLNGKPGRPGLRTARVVGESDGELFWILENGARWHGMPAWADLGHDKLWSLVLYLRSQQGEPATGAPTR
jgi:mono/diheme cytochrome c family protein